MNRSPIWHFLRLQAALALACFSAEAFCWAVLGLHYPYTCPVMVFPGDFFPDFTLLLDRIFVHFHTLLFFAPGDHHFMYPPAASLLYEPFALLPAHRVPAFLVSLALTLALMAGLFARALIHRGMKPLHAIVAVVAAVLLSYPVWFAVQRGNTEMFIWALTALGVWAFYRGRGYSAAACFGVVGAMKIYPAVFLGLLFSRRQYRQIAFGLLVLTVLTLACAWLEYPDIALSLRETVKGLQTFQFDYVQGRFPPVISYDHSLLSLIKRVVQPSAPLLALTSRLYLRGFALFGLILFLVRIQKLPLANQVLTLTVATILFPPVSFDYTLLHLYTPLCLMLLLFWGRPLPRGTRLALPVFALLLSPLTEFIHAGHTFEGQLKSVLLIVLFAIGLAYPLPSDEVAGEASARARRSSPGQGRGPTLVPARNSPEMNAR